MAERGDALRDGAKSQNRGTWISGPTSGNPFPADEDSWTSTPSLPTQYPFGKLYNESGSAVNILRFPGQFADAAVSNSALYYNGYRWYGSRQGRYEAVDPLEGAKHSTQFLYTDSNPIIYIDYFGLYKIYCKFLSPPVNLCCDPPELERKRDFAGWALNNLYQLYVEGRGRNGQPPKKCGGIDESLNQPYIESECTNDPCVQWCMCRHENEHNQQSNNPKHPLHGLANSSYNDQGLLDLEKPAWIIYHNCLTNWYKHKTGLK